MEDTSENKPIKHRKQVSAALLAHVDAGKTTLSEAMLYTGGNIRKLGRVDRGDAFLDTYELEKKRGITIFSKQAVCRFGDMEMTLLDTPGHVDFSAEMERTLQVLDYAILVISGLDGVQGHTRTLWRLLARYQVPVFLFVNKMDLAGERKAALLEELRSGLDGNCVDFSGMFGGEEAGGKAGEHVAGAGGEPVWPESFYEAAAMCREDALEEYLETGAVSDGLVRSMISGREMFPCFFGSALKLDGVEEFLKGMEWFMETPKYPEEFGARVFKISRDGQGNRLAYLKITGGSLKVKDMVDGEKVNQIRVYSGEKFETLPEAEAGTICAVTGLTRVAPGQGLGYETASVLPVLEPVLTYRLILPEEVDAAAKLPKLAQLEEEDPKLHITWEESKKEIHVQLMGEIQMEILKSLVKERFGVDVEFGERSIVYKETILNTVEGVGHFEPLRHYAEVHLLLEPGEAGSGLQFAADCREEVLEKKIGTSSSEETMEVGGLNYIADIMNHVDRSTERDIFDELNLKNPQLAEDVRKLMFVFEDIAYLDPLSIQRFLRETDSKDLAVALKVSNKDVMNAIFANMSNRMRESIQSDMEYLHNIRMSDVEEAQQRIVAVIRRLEEEGEIVISKDGKDEIIV